MDNYSKSIPTFSLPDLNVKFPLKLDKEDSEFDVLLKKRWNVAEGLGVLRYSLNIEAWKILEGKFGFLAQLNVNRGERRRTPEEIDSMDQEFQPTKFNFTKIKEQEILIDLKDRSGQDIIAINVSPLENYHCLLITRRFDSLPQVVTLESIKMALKLFVSSQSRYLRLAFNSLCAHASVNHLHWHVYYLEHYMQLEWMDLEDFVKPVFILRNHPAKGFCVKFSEANNLENLACWAFLIINHLQNHRIAHNIYVTRGREGDYGDLRVYIWARKSFKGIKDTCSFIPAVCELFGHLSIRSKEAYEVLTEDQVSNILEDITNESFESVVEEVRKLLMKNLIRNEIM